MPHMQPFDRAPPAQRFGEAVEAVTDDAVNAFHAGLGECLGDEVGDIVDPHEMCPLMRSETARRP